jgi:hypothetical protein
MENAFLFIVDLIIISIDLINVNNLCTPFKQWNLFLHFVVSLCLEMVQRLIRVQVETCVDWKGFGMNDYFVCAVIIMEHFFFFQKYFQTIDSPYLFV